MTVEAHIGVAEVVQKINDELAKIPRSIDVSAGTLASQTSTAPVGQALDRAALARELYAELSALLARDARLAATR